MEENPEFVDRLMKPVEVAKVLSISVPYLYKLMQWGKVPSVRIGNAVRVRKSDLISYIEKMELQYPGNF